MSLQFEPVWSWLFAIAVFAAVLSVIRIAYPRRIQHLSPAARNSLIALRVLIAVVLFLMTLRPVMMLESDDQSNAVMYLLCDASKSMNTEDIPEGGTRRQALQKLKEAADASLEAIGKKAEIRIRDFSDSIQTTATVGNTAEGSMTAIGKVLELSAEEMGKEKVPAVILLSDGKQAAPGALDVDPVSVARRFGRQQRPVYSVGFGSTEAATASLDLALEDLDLSREVFQGNVLPIKVRLRSAGAQGQKVSVRVLLENRTGLFDGKSGPLEPLLPTDVVRPLANVTPQSPSEEQTIQLQIVPEQIGDLKLVVQADPLPGEVRPTNNRVETIIRVRRGGIRVAYFDIVRSEQKWLRKINDSTRVQLDFHPIRGGKLLGNNQIPDRFFQPGNYDGYIIGDVPASAFKPAQLKEMARCLTQGAGLMMTGGASNLGQGGYTVSPLAPFLPIELGAENRQLNQPQKMLPSRDGLSHYVMQIAAPDQNRAHWEALPPLAGANAIAPKQNSLAQVLATSDQGFPLLIGQGTGQGRALVFAGDTTWLWATQGFEEEHMRFWRQVIFWLTRKETDDSQAVWIQATPRDLTPGQATELTFGARDPQGNALADATFVVEVTDPQGKITPVTPRAAAGMSLGDFTDTLAPGDYWARVKASRNGEVIGGIGVTRFYVNARDPELDDPSADYSLLREVSHASGGEFLSQEQFLEKLKQWAEDGLPGLSLVRQERISLWDNWGTLLFLIVLMTAEWALRKKVGLV
ncbi:MAG: glutamine amidotransferase [Planctomycetaceae bacterium]